MAEKMIMETIRQQIIAYLSKGPMNALEISQEVGIMEKEVYPHLGHISRSVEAQGKNLVIHASMCLTCGFIFEARRRFTRPGRCPQCKGTRIQRPEYEIR